ncbi:transglycosylase SLT domain-containing protein [Glutamicibacter ardleyensis]|uniref:transglycosylase SLT domain-containing protein n=1 Tax=Glutamicibacter ardleyensis TaxID=225894 RepID=UPI003FCF99A4
MKKVFGTFAAVLIACIAIILGLALVTALVSTAGPSADKKDDEQEENISCSPGSGADNIPEEYREFIFAAAENSGFDASILAAQIDQESSWNPEAVSPSDAKGIAQFLDSTWKEHGNGGDVFDPEDAILAQGAYMKWIKEYLSDNGFSDADNMLELTLAGYNAGIGNVVKSGGIPRNAETEAYVKEIPALAQSKYKDACLPLDSENNDIEFVNSGKWSSPLPGARFSSGYGMRPCPTGNCTPDAMNHQGIDLSTGGGSNVLAPADMEVTFAGNKDYWAQWYGTWILGEQIGGEKFVFEFHHCVHGSLKVSKGQKVTAGTPLCTEGNTGNSKGAHLHFQVGKPGTDPTQPTRRKTLDPKPILIAKKVL